MKVISYNLRKDRASAELVDLVVRHDPDVLCVQEADTMELPSEVGPLHLADSTHRNRLGLALFYRRDRFGASETKAFSLKKSLHDRVLRPAHERLIATRLSDHVTGRSLVVASFHAAPLTALNSLRREQIRAAHEELKAMGPDLPTLMVGDYNYPVFRAGLTENLRDNGYELSLSDARTYTRYKFFRGHFDFATSSGLDIGSVTTLPRGASDHLPILVEAHLRDSGAQTQQRRGDFVI